MAPFVSALDAFHEGTRPSNWLEGLVKAYVGDGLASDFYREIAGFLPEPDRALVLEVLADTGHADFAVREVRAAIKADRRVPGPAVAVGTAPRGRGDDPVAGGDRRARRAGRADHQRHRRPRRRRRRAARSEARAAQAVSVEHDGLPADHRGNTATSGSPPPITRITDAHAKRMKALGLNP